MSDRQGLAPITPEAAYHAWRGEEAGGVYAPPMPAEAATEVGADHGRRKRLGHAGRRHCWLVKHQAGVASVVAFLALAAILWSTKP